MNFDKFLIKSINPVDVKAQILSCEEKDLQKAGQLIAEGKLVAFPTETVYGLGADALNEKAVLSIFETKRRPLTDPVIVHVCNIEQALSLVEITKEEESLFRGLAEKFWPGPLTLIFKAGKMIPDCVTASTGYVGIRCPNQEHALKLISYAKRPIAAPSANLFSHVSPTSAGHVFHDLYVSPISIIDGPNSTFGVESTVVKVLPSLDLQILRFGSISPQALISFLEESPFSSKLIISPQQKKNVAEINESTESPGQLLKHYSPHCSTFLLQIQNTLNPLKTADTNLLNTEVHIETEETNDKVKEINKSRPSSSQILKKSILLDFAGVGLGLAPFLLAYEDLSEKGEILEAMARLYEKLRWAENIEGVEQIFILDLESFFKEELKLPEFYETVYDKTYRSSSGKKVTYDVGSKEFLDF